jgi:hypothetical protein
MLCKDGKLLYLTILLTEVELYARINQDSARVKSFMDKLETMLDPRDNRGKRHRLPFVLAAVSIAILAGRARVSDIHRYIQNKIDWLRVTTQPLPPD